MNKVYCWHKTARTIGEGWFLSITVERSLTAIRGLMLSRKKVIAKKDTGGLIRAMHEGYIANSYYDMETSGQSDEGKGTPKTLSLTVFP